MSSSVVQPQSVPILGRTRENENVSEDELQPAKRLRTEEDEAQVVKEDAPNTKSTKVIPARTTTAVKRIAGDDAAPSPSEPTTPFGKKHKVEHNAEYSPVPTPIKNPLVSSVGATELASAMALASLALSPHNSPSSNHLHSAIQTRQEESVGMGGMARAESYSPRTGPTPVSPEASSLSPSLQGGDLVDGADTAGKSVSFATQLQTTRTIPAVISRRRLMRPKGPRAPMTYAQQQKYPPPASPSRLPINMRRAHYWMVPPTSIMMPPPPPPPTLMARSTTTTTSQASRPPPQGREGTLPWICDYCNDAAFATYEEACVHERSCVSIRHKQTKSEKEDQGEPTQDVKAREWSTGSVPLCAGAADKLWLSELNCFVRKHCVEAFAATAEDVARTSKRGRVVLSQVGIRCKFCTQYNEDDSATAAVSYPTSISGIYESVKRWQRVHLPTCRGIPDEVRAELEGLQNANVWVPTTRQYWTDSAKALGLVNTSDGIRFERSPGMEPDWKPRQYNKSIASDDGSQTSQETSSSDDESSDRPQQQGGHIVFPCDEGIVPPYVFFLMNQVEPCTFSEADRFVARSKGPVGYPGFQCRHCSGHAGLGKYFPQTPKSLSTNSTSQNIHAHLLKCRKVPPYLKNRLLELKADKTRRLHPGWRKTFFDIVWERLHG